MSDAPIISVNLIADWMQMMRRQLEAVGLPTASLHTLQDVSLAYWNYRLRHIDQVPRSVNRAREFVCPPQHKAVLDELTAKLERGEDVNRYRSRAAFDPAHQAFNDRLLNDWGVQHFHLGPDNPDDIVTKRTGYCVYVYLTPTAAYLLDVMHHGNYHKQELMLRMHRNWPDVIAQYRARDVTVDEEDQFDDDSIKSLRRIGLSYMLTLDGVAYFAPGGGYMKSGHSWRVLRISDRALNQVAEWQKRLEDEASDIVEQLRRDGYETAEPPTFKLVVRKDWYCSAAEYTAKTKIDMGYLLAAEVRR